MPDRFTPFSSEHLAALAAGAMVVAALILGGRSGGRGRQITTGILAFLNLAAYPLCVAANLRESGPIHLDNLLPFQMCDIAAIAAGFALLTHNRTLCRITYFWGLAATFQALLTPAITIGAAHPTFAMFFVKHFAVVGASLFLPLAAGWRPAPPIWREAVSAWAWANVYLVCAFPLNLVLGTNFAFFSHKPPNPSLIDHLGPWPWYILSFEVLSLTLFGMLLLPFTGLRRAAK